MQKLIEESRARKIAVQGVGSVGFTPYEMAVRRNNIEEENRATSIFDEKLKSLVDEFNSNTSLGGARLVFVNTTGIYTRNQEIVTGTAN